MKWISQCKLFSLAVLAAMPLAAQAYTVIINGTSFETSRPPSVDVDYLSNGVRVTISEVDITAEASSSSSSSSSSTDSQCTSTWGCGSDSSSDDSSSDDSSSDDSSSQASDDVNLASTGECTNTSRVACHNQDWGPNGLGSFWSTPHTVPGGKVFAVPFTVRSGPGPYGAISTSRQVGQSTNGYSIRMWFSATPGGERLDNTDACGRVTTATGGVRWAQASDRAGYCNLPSTTKKTYYYNVALCNSASSSDIECLGKSDFNPQSFTIRFKASNY